MVAAIKNPAPSTDTLALDMWSRDLGREHGFEPLRVEGTLPPALRGTLYRNGPGQFGQFGRRYAHPFEGDGAVTAVRFEDGRAQGASKVTLLLTHRSSSFLGALGLPNFGIASPTALKKYKADAGSVDAGGVFRPGGTFATRNPVGTGPYMLSSWDVGNKLTLVRNPHYWGKKAKLDRVIFKPIGDTTARLQALQSGELQGFDGAAPQDWPTISGNSKLKLLKRQILSLKECIDNGRSDTVFRF